MWYRSNKMRLAQAYQGSGAKTPLSVQQPQPKLPVGINGPKDETPVGKNLNDPYAVGRTRAIDNTDKMLKNPAVDYFQTGMEAKLEGLHHEQHNVLGPQSMSSMEDGDITYKGQNSADLANAYKAGVNPASSINPAST